MSRSLSEIELGDYVIQEDDDIGTVTLVDKNGNRRYLTHENKKELMTILSTAIDKFWEETWPKKSNASSAQ